MDNYGLLVYKCFLKITHIRILILVAVFIVCCLVKINHAKPAQVKFREKKLCFFCFTIYIFDLDLVWRMKLMIIKD